MLLQKLRNIKSIIRLYQIYWYDFKNDLQFTTMYKGEKMSEDSLLASLVVGAHTIEKGLTMPNKRFNFGHAQLHTLLKGLEYCAKNFGSSDDRFKDVAEIILEYKKWHDDNNQEIKDKLLVEKINSLESDFPEFKPLSQQYDVTRDDYFSLTNSDFASFSCSRHSCRNLSGGSVDEEALRKAIELATNAPSTCNRQSIRVHVLNTKKSILDIQHGNRGFGHLADKFILLTSKLSHWPGSHQRHAPYVDGGIFLMNLLYSLHHYRIAACTLNMFLDVPRTRKLQLDFELPSDEVPIALIAIGTPPEKFDLAKSTRRNTEKIVTYHN